MTSRRFYLTSGLWVCSERQMNRRTPGWVGSVRSTPRPPSWSLMPKNHDLSPDSSLSFGS